MRPAHAFVGQRWWSAWASYSSRKNCIVLLMTTGESVPWKQFAYCIDAPSDLMCSGSSGDASPRAVRSRISTMRWLPPRHVVQRPQDSASRNQDVQTLRSITHAVSSRKTMPPPPMPAPSGRNGSGSSERSAAIDAGSKPDSGPPCCIALNGRPPAMPPTDARRSLTFVPKGTSTQPVRATWPETVNIFVPRLSSVPTVL